MKLRASLAIDLERLKSNFKKLNVIAPKNKVLFMVKADAYGHGLINIVHYCATVLGLKEFGCASLEEALILRHGLPELEFDIYVFSDARINDLEAREYYINKRIIPVIASVLDLETILSDTNLRFLPLCLKFNTGMNRLGIKINEKEKVARLLQKSGKNDIDHLMSHFSSSALSMKTNKKNISQILEFRNLKMFFASKNISIEKSSIANSGAIEQGVGLEETHIRPGLMMYGPSSLLPSCRQQSSWSGEILSEFQTIVLDVFKVCKGEPVGYGATPMPDSGLIAVIGIGYGDGLSTHFQGAEVEINGVKGQIVGRVNMDMAQVLFPDTECRIKKGDTVIIWSHDQSQFEQLAKKIKTIPYEIFLSITSRVSKYYI